MKFLNSDVNIKLLSLCLFFFLFGLTINVKAGRIFNIQLESPLEITDSLHGISNSVQLLSILFEEEAKENITITYQVFDMNNQLVFTGLEADWQNIENQNLKLIKRKAEFFFHSDNTKIYKIFSPISDPDSKSYMKIRKTKRFKKIITASDKEQKTLKTYL